MEPTSGGGAAAGYADSLDSSPRSRGTDSEPFSSRWDEPPTLSGQPAPKLRLMCSYGGRIVPRPHDKSLCYLGGDTRIVVVDRHTSLSDLCSNLSRHVLTGSSFSLKYQLPTEDLDSLISVTTDEDLENMIEEYDRCCSSNSAKPSRLRLFLFPCKSDSVSSISSLLEDSKTETWFVDALNGARVVPRRMSGDSDVNCLLGLDGNSGGRSGEIEEQLPDSGKAGVKGVSSNQEIQSVPDSPMMDTTSSFGSASSAPSLSNLPPIRVHHQVDDLKSQEYTRFGLEEQFAQLNVGQKFDEGFKDGGGGFVLPPNVSSEKGLSENERLEQSLAGLRKPPAPLPPQQKPSDLPISESAIRDNSVAAASIPRSKPVVYQDPVVPITLRDQATVTMSMAPGSNQFQTTILDHKPPVSDPNYRFQMQIQEPSYVLSMHPDQQQYYHYLHHQPVAPPPIPSYFQQMHHLHLHQQQQQQQQQQIQQSEQQFPMYYLHQQAAAMGQPLRTNQAYNLPMQTSLGDSQITSSNKFATAEAPLLPKLSNPPAIQPPTYKESPVFPQPPASTRSAIPHPRPEMAANLYRTAASTIGAQQLPAAPLIHMSEQQQLAGYHPLHLPPHPAHLAYDLSDQLQAQMPYHLPTSTTMNPQYQTVSPTTSEASPQSPSDTRQTRNP